MDLEAADELETTPVREFARARMQEIYDKISSSKDYQTHGTAPEHPLVHLPLSIFATRHLVHRLIEMFSTLSKMQLNDENEEDIANLLNKCQCIIQELRTKRIGSTVAAAEHDLINEMIADLCVAKHMDIVFEQLAAEAQTLATWAEQHRRESSDYLKVIRDISIEEIDATRHATYPRQGPYVAPKHVPKAPGP